MMLEKTKNELEIKAHELESANTEINQLFKRVEAKNKELLQFDQLKSDFVSMVAHELRSPLTVIKESIALLSEGIVGEVNPKQKDMLRIGDESIERLLRIINDLLDLAKIEAGKIDLNLEQVNIKTIVQYIADSFQPKIKKEGLELRVDIPVDPIDVYVDSDKISQVIINLISNAAKFTKEGSITIGIKERDTDVVCSITDTGVGMNEQDLKKLFNKFQQFGQHKDQKEKGTGLGLSISKGIVEMHNGVISVASEPNKGTTFSFTIPKYSPKNILAMALKNKLKTITDEQQKLCCVVVNNEDIQGEIKDLALQDMGNYLSTNLPKPYEIVVLENKQIIVFAETNQKDASQLNNQLQKYIKEYCSKIPVPLDRAIPTKTYIENYHALDVEPFVDKILKS